MYYLPAALERNMRYFLNTGSYGSRLLLHSTYSIDTQAHLVKSVEDEKIAVREI